eukprot:1073896-Rhodomonas_salina.1
MPPQSRIQYLPSPRRGMHDHVETHKVTPLPSIVVRNTVRWPELSARELLGVQATFGDKLSLVFRSKSFEVTSPCLVWA